MHNKNMHPQFQNILTKNTSHTKLVEMIFLVSLASFSGNSEAMAFVSVETDNELKMLLWNYVTNMQNLEFERHVCICVTHRKCNIRRK